MVSAVNGHANGQPVNAEDISSDDVTGSTAKTTATATTTTTADSTQEYDTVPLQINGKPHLTSTTFPITSPATGKKIYDCASASLSDVEAAVQAAQAAFPSWSKTKPSLRRDIVLRAADIFQARADECRRYMVEETGSQTAFFDFLNLPLTLELMRDCAGRIAGALKGEVPVAAAPGTNAMVLKVPYGVVLAIAPWNAPYILGMRSVMYAIAAGNTAILKGPEFAPRTAWVIGDIFREAGLPDGVLNVLFHRPADAASITTALIAHPFVKKINFTGSTAVGSIIAGTAGKYLKPVLMELGGKASAIVLPDADLDLAAKSCMLGAFLHSGQICMSTERIVVHREVATAFTEKLKAATQAGDDAPAPILITPASVQKSIKLIRGALDQGASLLTGSCDVDDVSTTRLRPIIVENVTKDMDLYHQETFGPSVSIVVVDSEQEAIEVANDTEYGLTSAVFTRDLGTGFRVAHQIQSGAVHINSMTVHDEAGLPHGGVKKSGFGRFNGSAGFEEFLQSKTLTWQD